MSIISDIAWSNTYRKSTLSWDLTSVKNQQTTKPNDHFYQSQMTLCFSWGVSSTPKTFNSPSTEATKLKPRPRSKLSVDKIRKEFRNFPNSIHISIASRWRSLIVWLASSSLRSFSVLTFKRLFLTETESRLEKQWGNMEGPMPRPAILFSSSANLPSNKRKININSMMISLHYTASWSSILISKTRISVSPLVETQEWWELSRLLS